MLFPSFPNRLSGVKIQTRHAWLRSAVAKHRRLLERHLANRTATIAVAFASAAFLLPLHESLTPLTRCCIARPLLKFLMPLRPPKISGVTPSHFST